MELRFHGYSDNNLEIDGDLQDEIEGVNCVASVVLKSSQGSLRVSGIYAPNDLADTWCIGIGPVIKNQPIPNWPVRFQLYEPRFEHRKRNRYSAELIIQCPDDTQIVREEF